MEVTVEIDPTRAALRRLPRPLGLVPTMGALHEGHLSLVRASRARDAVTVVSIFVNPTQFGPHEDFTRYPRDPERDLALLRAEGVALVFVPEPATMYPPDFDTYVEVGDIAHPLEGAARPGHFRGVATVVAKLFNVVQPDRAYFGEKDAQQVAVVRRLVVDLAFPLAVVARPTIREPDGLALSSRNRLLAPEERRAAAALYRALRGAQVACEQGERSAERLRDSIRAVLAEEPLARPEYVSVADPATLRELERVEGEALASLAVRVGATRLIDNLLIHPLPSPPGR